PMVRTPRQDASALTLAPPLNRWPFSAAPPPCGSLARFLPRPRVREELGRGRGRGRAQSESAEKRGQEHERERRERRSDRNDPTGVQTTGGRSVVGAGSPRAISG